MKKYLIIFLLIGGTIYILQKLNIKLPIWINNYCNDLLIIPIVLLSSLLVIRKLKNNTNYKFSYGIIIYIIILYSVFFEYYLPNNNPRYTKDYIDITLYFVGGFIFNLIQRETK